MELHLLPEPDESIRRAVARALAASDVALAPAEHEAYGSRWRLAGMAEGVASGAVAEDEDPAGQVYGLSPRSIRGVTRA